MGAIPGKLLRFLLALLLGPLVLAFTVAAFSFLGDYIQEWLGNWFTIGFFVSIPIWTILLAGGNSLTEWLEHELNHAILAKILFRRVERLEVTPYAARQKGVVELKPTGGCLYFLIVLAPYYLPLFTIPFLLVRPFVGQETVQNALDAIIGVTFAFHIVGLFFEFGRHQTDITRTGCLFSLAITVLFNVTFLMIIVSVVMDNLPALSDYFTQASQLTQEYYQAAIAALQGLVSNL